MPGITPTAAGQAEPRRKIPGRPDTGRVVKDASEWLVLLPGRLPAYITPEEYEANIARMAANRQTAAAPGAPRDGAALLSGLLRCGRCGGHRMTVSYHDVSARSVCGYTCAFYQTNYATGGRCQHIAGAAIDDYVAGQVLAAVAPAALEVSMAAAAQAEDERAMLDKLWRRRLERPLRHRPGPPPVPAGRAGEPARRPAAGSRLGGRPRRDGPAGSGLPAVRRGTAHDPHHG